MSAASRAPLPAPLPALRVFGHGCPGNSGLKGPGYAKASRDVMGVSWMTRDELDEAIPPAFAAWAGRQILAAPGCRAETEAA